MCFEIYRSHSSELVRRYFTGAEGALRSPLALMVRKKHLRHCRVSQGNKQIPKKKHFSSPVLSALIPSCSTASLTAFHSRTLFPFSLLLSQPLSPPACCYLAQRLYGNCNALQRWGESSPVALRLFFLLKFTLSPLPELHRLSPPLTAHSLPPQPTKPDYTQDHHLFFS